MEVLVAMGIFTVGFVAVAAIFPVATLLQRDTVVEISGQQVRASADALLTGGGLSQSAIVTDLASTTFDTDGRVYPVPALTTGPSATGAPPAEWVLRNRTFPSTVADPLWRTYLWVPLVQDSNTTAGVYSWNVFYFILKKDTGSIYPEKAAPDFSDANDVWWANPDDNSTTSGPNREHMPGVCRAVITNINGTNVFEFDNDVDNNGTPDKILVGNWVLDNLGNLYQVSEALDDRITISGWINGAPTHLWYSPPPAEGNPSPCIGIFHHSNSAEVVR